VDVAHPAYEDHIEVVRETLKDIGASEKPTIYIFNKVDLLQKEENSDELLAGINAFYKQLEDKDKDVVFVSAEQKTNIDELRDKIYRKAKKRHLQIFPNYLKDQYY
ncbi:MAG: GTPase HflX, partial [Fulvivirga sp.]